MTAQANKVSVVVSLLGSVFRACYVFICGWIYHMGRSHARRSFSGFGGYCMLVLLTSISLVVIIYKVVLVFYNFPTSHLCDINFSITIMDETHVTSSYEEESLEYWFVVLSFTPLLLALFQFCIWWLGACLWSCLYYRCILPLYVNSVHV